MYVHGIMRNLSTAKLNFRFTSSTSGRKGDFDGRGKFCCLYMYVGITLIINPIRGVEISLGGRPHLTNRHNKK